MITMRFLIVQREIFLRRINVACSPYPINLSLATFLSDLVLFFTNNYARIYAMKYYNIICMSFDEPLLVFCMYIIFHYWWDKDPLMD